MRILILPLLLAVTACALTPAETRRAAARAQTEQDKLAEVLAGMTPEKPVSCISQFPSSQQVKAYGATIVYTISRSLAYRSDTAGGCEGMAHGDVLVTKTSSGQVCSGDIARTFDAASRFPTGSCSFAEFTPYRRR